MEIVYGLWDELDRFPPGGADDTMRQFALKLKSLFRADNVKWIGAVRVIKGRKALKDPLNGWRLRAGYDLVPNTKEYERLIAPIYQRNNRLDPEFEIGLATHAQIRGAGKFRVHRLRDGWIPYREFCQTEHYRLHYTELGISDRMWINFPLNADTESIYLIDRMGSSQHFTKREALLAGAILRGVRGFHRRLFLNRGLGIGEQPLSPVLQRIIQKLLTGMSEKEIALSMDQSLPTTHKYIRAIYERFGVNGRAALMSLWLGN
jgi:DNA-binding CsgD family transcriptional regulator